jgi:hypothetical protein
MSPSEDRASKRVVTETLSILVQMPEGITVQQIVASSTLSKSTVGKALQTLAEQGKAKSERANAKEAAKWYPVAEEDIPAPQPRKRTRSAAPRAPREPGDGTKLARGQLGTQVLNMVQGRPGEQLSPTEVFKFLGAKSIGAVNNALDKLAATPDSGVTLTQAKPKRYTYSK